MPRCPQRCSRAVASVQVFGAVGRHAIDLFVWIGGTVRSVACLDRNSRAPATLVRQGGVDPEELRGFADSFGSIDCEKAKAAGYEIKDGEAWLAEPLDILIPAAMENQINELNVEAVGVLVDPETPAFEGFALPQGATGDHTEGYWKWRLRMAERLAAEMDGERFGVEALYLIGSTKNANAGPSSDIDLMIHFRGDDAQRRDLMAWLDGWSLCLGEINYLRTGYTTGGLLDNHLITDEDLEKRTPFAAKIGTVTDPARQLTLGPAAGQ